MKTAVSLVGVVSAYVLAFKVSPVFAGIMLVSHVVFEYMEHRDHREMVKQFEFYKNLDNNIHEQYAEKDAGNC